MARPTRIALALSLVAAGALASSCSRSTPAATPASPAPAGSAPSSAAAAPAPGAGDKASAAPSGQPGSKPSGEEFAALFADRLSNWASRQQIDASARGGIVRLGSGAVTLDTRLEHDNPPADKRGFGVGIAVGAAIDEEPAGTFYFIAPAVGEGRSRSEAIDVAVGGWLGLTGNALLEAVARRAASPKAIRVGGLVAFPGAVAVRGTVDLGWSPKRDAELLRAMAPVTQNLRPDLSHSIALTVMVLGAGAIDGQCLLDNRAADELCKLALKFDFPGSSEGYMFRQVYILRPALSGIR